MDNFSSGAADYALYRPGSPDGIFDFLYEQVSDHNTAWDCGTGNGQVAIRLSDKFNQVYATDISSAQLALAEHRHNVTYLQERAEQTSLADNSVDLITIAQAIHWFDFDNFYKEVRRVARPGALIAAWTYSLFSMTPEIDKVIAHFYWDITRNYWDKERAHIDAGYSTIPFPFREIKAPELQIIKSYTLDQLIGYLRTWSGMQHYIKQEKKDPIDLIIADLKNAWGSDTYHEIRWPVHVRAGRIS